MYVFVYLHGLIQLYILDVFCFQLLDSCHWLVQGWALGMWIRMGGGMKDLGGIRLGGRNDVEDLLKHTIYAKDNLSKAFLIIDKKHAFLFLR